MRKIVQKIILILVKKLEKFSKKISDNKFHEFDIIEDLVDFRLYLFKINGLTIMSPNPKIVLPLYNQIFRKEVYKFFSNKFQPKIIDCGSNIGIGILYWKNIFPNCEIIAFEPSLSNFKALEKNVVLNNLTNVTLINSAVSSQIGVSNFTDDDGVSGSLFLEKNLNKVYQVKTVRLDSYLTKNVDFLKIDIEGEEINILDQIKDNLHFVQNLFIEYHSFNSRPQNLSKILKMLESASYRYYLEGEYSNSHPLCNNYLSYNQDLQVSIWARRNG